MLLFLNFLFIYLFLFFLIKHLKLRKYLHEFRNSEVRKKKGGRDELLKFNKGRIGKILNKDNLDLPIWPSCECCDQMVLMGMEGKVTMGGCKEMW